MKAFDLDMLTDDLQTVHTLFADLLPQLSAHDWQRHTEKNGGGWTLQETVAHLDAAATGYQVALEAALAGETADFHGATRREELPTWNAQQIAQRLAWPIPTLCASFLGMLQTAVATSQQIAPTDLQKTAATPFYNRPLILAELLGSQAAHPGLVHAAQVANGAKVPPLWQHYDAAMHQRQLTRMFHLMALSYWPQRGGNLRATLNFSVPRRASWHLCLSPEGCAVAEGKGKRPLLSLWFRSLDALCQSLTQQVNPIQATLRGHVLALGDLRLVFRLGNLFTPA
jgi:hypothetical protein